MDIRNWSMDQILQLPDHLLSRRYVVSAALDLGADETAWDISELGLPDMAIVHEMFIFAGGAFGKSMRIRLALGDQLPTITAEMDRLEPLFMGLGYQGPEPRTIQVSVLSPFRMNRLRMFVPAQGRRLILEGVTAVGDIIGVIAGIVVSGVPTEVPDCLL